MIKKIEILMEQDEEVKRILKKASEEKNADLEAWEWAFKSSPRHMHYLLTALRVFHNFDDPAKHTLSARTL